jgi:hypothetical protein
MILNLTKKQRRVFTQGFYDRKHPIIIKVNQIKDKFCKQRLQHIINENPRNKAIIVESFVKKYRGKYTIFDEKIKNCRIAAFYTPWWIIWVMIPKRILQPMEIFRYRPRSI